MENKFFIDDLVYDEAECEEKYDHKYFGQEGLREIIGIVKYQLRELKSVSDGHDLRLQDLENAVAIIEDRLNANDKRLDEFAIDMESSEPLTIEQAVDAILQYVRDIDSVELGSEVLSVQEAFDLVEDQIADVESDLQEQIDELGSEFDGVVEELEDGVVKSIEYNGESFKPEDIYDKPQPEDKDLGYEESSEGFIPTETPGVHYVIKAIANSLKYTKELDKCVLEYDFGAKCLNEHDFLNIDGFGFKLTLGDEVLVLETGLKNATEIRKLDEHNFFISDTLKSAGSLEIERSEEAVELDLIWQLETLPLEDPEEVLQLVYHLVVPALGDDVYRENVVVIPTDIDLSDATVRVGEGSEEEKKTIKDAIDDLHQAIEDEEEARKSEDAELQEELDQLDGEAVKVVKVAGEPLEKDSEGAVNIERADALMVEAGEDHDLHDLTVAQHLNALYNNDASLAEDLKDEAEERKAITERLDNIKGLFEDSETDAFPLETILALEHDRITEESSERESEDIILHERIDEILRELGKIVQISYSVVEELPEVGELGVIYLIKVESSEEDNVYEEYIFLGEGSEGHFELIGSTRVDLGDIYNRLEALELDKLANIAQHQQFRRDINDNALAIDRLEGRLDNFNESGEAIEDAIYTKDEVYNKPEIDEMLESLSDSVIKNVAVNNEPLEIDSEGKVNVPLVSRVYDGVVPKYNGTPVGTLQDGDIVLVMRNNVPIWTEVDIYSLDPDVEPTLAISYARCGYPYSGGIMDDIALDPLEVQEETHAYYWINSGIRTDEPIQFEISVNTPVIDSLNIDPSLGDPSIELSGYNNWQFINNVTLDDERRVLIFWLSNGGNEMDSGNIDIVFHTEGGQELTVSIVVETRG